MKVDDDFVITIIKLFKEFFFDVKSNKYHTSS